MLRLRPDGNSRNHGEPTYAAARHGRGDPGATRRAQRICAGGDLRRHLRGRSLDFRFDPVALSLERTGVSAAMNRRFVQADLDSDTRVLMQIFDTRPDCWSWRASVPWSASCDRLRSIQRSTINGATNPIARGIQPHRCSPTRSNWRRYRTRLEMADRRGRHADGAPRDRDARPTAPRRADRRARDRLTPSADRRRARARRTFRGGMAQQRPGPQPGASRRRPRTRALPRRELRGPRVDGRNLLVVLAQDDQQRARIEVMLDRMGGRPAGRN